MNGLKVNYISSKGMDRMLSNGWNMVLPSSYRETAEELHSRLSATYAKVKVYYCSTAVRGYHDWVAFVKR